MGGTLVPGKVTQVVRCPCMAPPVSYHTMTMHRLHVTAHNRDAATLRVSQRSPNRQSGSPWGTRLLWGSASHLEMSILRSALVSCNSWSCISGPDIVIPALNLNSYSRRHLEKKSNLWTVFSTALSGKQKVPTLIPICGYGRLLIHLLCDVITGLYNLYFAVLLVYARHKQASR